MSRGTWLFISASDHASLIGKPSAVSLAMELAELPNITVQVLPFAVGEHSGMAGAFHLFDLGQTGPPTAHVDYHTGSVFVEEPDEVREYAAAFQYLTASALDPRSSVQRIRQAAEEIPS